MSLATSDIWRRPGFALLVPALLLAVGCWQLSRVAGEAERYDAVRARIDQAVARLAPVAAANPDETITFTNGPTVSAKVALAMMRDDATAFDHDALMERARAVAAWVVIAGGALGLVAATIGLVATARGAARGLRSRDHLVAAFGRVVRLLPPILGTIAASTALALLAGVLFEAGGLWFAQTIGGNEIKLIVGGLIFGGAAVLFAVGAIRRLLHALDEVTPTPVDVLGRTVGPEEAPGLWAFLREVAGRQGAGVPDHVVLGLTEGFFVTEFGVKLAPGDRLLAGRTLYLSAAFLPMLSPAELSAIIAHELAHFTGEDTQYSQRFLPLHAGLWRGLAAVTTGGATTGIDAPLQPAALLASHVMTRFDHTVRHWSRLREFEADRASLGASADGGRGAATALVRTGMGNTLINESLRELYGRPARAGDDMVADVLARAGAVGFADPAAHLEDRQPHPTDTHPPTRQRIEALGVPIDDALLAEAARPVGEAEQSFAASLFADWQATRRSLGIDLLGVAREQDRQYQTALEKTAGAIAGDVEVHERSLQAAIGFGVAGLLLFAAGGFLFWIQSSTRMGDGGPVLLAVAAVILLAGAALLWWGWSRHRRARSGPFLVVGPEGFRCRGVVGLVPWSTVAGVEVAVGRAFVTRFGFLDSAPLPELPRNGLFVRLDRKKRVLSLTGMVPRGMKLQPYLDLLDGALRAYRAREILRQREADAAAT